MHGAFLLGQSQQCRVSLVTGLCAWSLDSLASVVPWNKKDGGRVANRWGLCRLPSTLKGEELIFLEMINIEIGVVRHI